jgi:hypothetical protein
LQNGQGTHKHSNYALLASETHIADVRHTAR